MRTRHARPTRSNARQVWDTHIGVDGFDQATVSKAVVSLYGAGGIGGALAHDATKHGVGELHICDPDYVELSNLNRQLFKEEDVGLPKAHALVRRLAPYSILGTVLHGHPLYLEEFLDKFPALRPNAGVVGVDNDKGRLAAIRHHLRMRIPLVCVALTSTASGGQVIVQEPGKACVACYLGAVLGKRKGACPGSPAIIDCVKTVCGFASFALRTLLTGAPRDWNVLTVDLRSGKTTPLMIPRRPNCELCSGR